MNGVPAEWPRETFQNTEIILKLLIHKVCGGKDRNLQKMKERLGFKNQNLKSLFKQNEHQRGISDAIKSV